MKRRVLVTMAVLTATAGMAAAPMNSQAAGEVFPVENGKGYVVIGSSNDISLDEIKDKLTIPSICLEELLNKLCPDHSGGGQDTPETEAPETETPETNVPDAPETETPETSVPDAPETETPETNVPEIPETEAPETDAPGTENPGTPDQGKTYAEQVVDLVNQERAKEGLSALKIDTSVASAALVRAKETETSFSHTRPNGSSFSTALTEQGVKFRGSGENIAWGQKSPEEVMTAWMNSPGHRANILNANYTTIGVGYYQNSAGTNYWTQLFTY